MLPADSPFASLPAPGPHPATAELRAYAAGTLSAADEHRIEAHALDCERCAELLEGFSMSDAATTDQALAGLRARLQTRVADDLTEPLLLPASRPLWPRLAAGMALLGAIGAGLWGWEHQPAARVATTAPRKTAAVATAPAVASPTAVAPPTTSATDLPPQSVAKAPTANTTPAADYAAVLPARHQAARGRIVHRAASTPPAAAAEYDTQAAMTDAVAAIQTPPAATEAKDIASRSAAPTPPGEPAASTLSEVPAAASKAVVAAAPRAAAPAKKAADTTATVADVALGTPASESKAFESSTLVRDKPLTAAIAIAPAPVEGTPALRSYLHREAAKFELEEGAKPLNGVVRLRFIVGADGKLSNLQVVRGMRADYDEEALRMICEGPAWRPGIAGGRRAALPVEVTVSF